MSPAPVDISTAWRDLTASSHVVALNELAQFRIDVSHVVRPGKDTIAVLNAGELHFPAGCVQARLTTAAGTSVVLRNKGVGVGNDVVNLLVSSSGELPLETRFVRVEIRADCPITRTRVYWQNARL